MGATLTVRDLLPHSGSMIASAAPGPAPLEPLLFGAELHPHRSLSPAGFRVLMVACAVAFLGLGAVFFVAGAWPVIGFCGLELVLIYVFFKLNFRDLRRCETLRLTDGELEVRRVAPDGTIDRVVFQSHWLRVRLEERVGRSNRLLLASHGREISVGEFLSPDERADLARALNAALARRRHSAGA